jgi:hypothetical protein
MTERVSRRSLIGAGVAPAGAGAASLNFFALTERRESVARLACPGPLAAHQYERPD